MEFDIPIRVTAFLYDLEKKLILFVGALYTYLQSVEARHRNLYWTRGVPS